MLDAELYRELSPEQYTFVELHAQSDVELIRRIYRTLPRLGERHDSIWNVSFVREIDMSTGSFLFRDSARLKASGGVLHSPWPSTAVSADGAPFEIDDAGERWKTPDRTWYEDRDDFTEVERWVDSRGKLHFPGELDNQKVAFVMRGFVPVEEMDQREALPIIPSASYLPLFEGRLVHQFDHCQKAYVRGAGRRAKWIELPWDQKRIVPHYFVAEEELLSVCPTATQIRISSASVTGQTNERTCLAALGLVGMGCGHSINVAITDGGILSALTLAAIENSFVFDFLARLQISNNASPYILRSLPVPRQADSTELSRAAGRLACTTPETSPVWQALSERWPEEFPIPWTRERACLDVRERASLRAGLDARVAQMYGLSALEYARILSTFTLLDQDQPPLPEDVFIRRTNKGEKVQPRGFITRDLALLAFFNLLGQDPPDDTVEFFAKAGVDIERQTGPIRNLRHRVEEAHRRGAVAYVPSTGKGWSPTDSPYLPADLPQALLSNWDTNLRDWIVEDPQLNGGQPTLRSTRIAASMVSDLLNRGWTFGQVLESYPHLTPEQVAVALRWGQLQ
jgi:uncharacterized protein (DUF433 family)